MPALTVAFWSQVAGSLALAAVLAIQGVRPIAAGFAWGLAAGVGGGCALLLFYRGLADGTMSIVAPISACGAVVPVAAALLTGNHPGPTAGLGVLTALAGIILVSRPTRPTPPGPARRGPALPGPVAVGRPGRVVAMALGAALGFGLFYVFVDAGTAAPGASPLWVVAGARTSSLLVLGAIGLATLAASPRRPDRRVGPGALRWPGRRLGPVALVGSPGRRVGPGALRWPGRRLGPVALVGVADTGANLLFAYAVTSGNLAVVGVLGSLYPIATVVLARWLLGERLSGGQNAGVSWP